MAAPLAIGQNDSNDRSITRFLTPYSDSDILRVAETRNQLWEKFTFPAPRVDPLDHPAPVRAYKLVETMHMVKKGQLDCPKGEVLSAADVCLGGGRVGGCGIE